MRESGRDVLIILLLCSPFLFGGIALTSFHDPQQGVYGDVAVAMVESGDWVTPRFNGVPYFDYPPLFYWLSALTVSVVGPSEWTIRLWSALPALLTALLIWRIGEQLYQRYGGLLAAVVFSSNVAMLLYVRMPATDFLLLMFLTLCLTSFVEITVRGAGDVTRGFWVVTFYMSIGLALLAKGLLGLILPGLILGAFTLASHGWRRMREFRGPLRQTLRMVFCSGWTAGGIVILLATVLPWYVLAELQNPGFFQHHVVENQWLRFLNARSFVEDDIPANTVAFLIVALLLFFPWSVFLPAGWRMGLPAPRSRATAGQALRLMVGVWAGVSLLFFSFSSSKLEHYSLPAFPALSLMVGGYWAEALHARTSRSLSLILACAAAVLAVVGMALVLSSERITPNTVYTAVAEIDVYYRILRDQGVAFPFESLSPFREFAKGVGVALLIGFPLAFFLWMLRRPGLSFAAIFGLIGLIFFFGLRLAPEFETLQSSEPVARRLAELLEPGDRVVHEGLLEYSAGLPFYTRLSIQVLNGRGGIMTFGAGSPKVKDTFLDMAGFRQLWGAPGRVFFVTRFPENKSAIRKLPCGTVFSLGRYGARWIYSNRPVGGMSSRFCS